MLMVAVAMLWGSNFPAVKAIMEGGVSPPEAAALRFSIAAAALSPMLVTGGPLPAPLVWGGLECGCWLALGYIGQALALQSTHAGVVAFIASLQVVLVPLLLTLTGAGRFTPRLALSAMLCVGGVGMLELGGTGVAGASGGHGAELLALLQPVGFGTSYLRIERLMKAYPENGLQLSALQLISNAAISIGWVGCAWFASAEPPDLSALQGAFAPVACADGAGSLGGLGCLSTATAVAGGLLWTGLISTALTVLLQTRALGKLPATDSSVIVATEPVWAAGFASALLSETLQSSALLGGALIVSGCLANAVLPEDFAVGDEGADDDALVDAATAIEVKDSIHIADAASAAAHDGIAHATLHDSHAPEGQAPDHGHVARVPAALPTSARLRQRDSEQSASATR